MKDGLTLSITNKMNDWGLDQIYKIEDDMENIEDNVPQIINYLKDIHFSMPIGLAIRRYICEFLKAEVDTDSHRYVFTLDNGATVTTGDYMYNKNYDITSDDISEYVKLFCYINEKYNSDENGVLILTDITKAEIRRLLKLTTYCTRKKMFLLSFALHMNSEYTAKFLTDILAEQTYNYREPTEIIALFCQSDEERNSYQNYMRLCSEFEKRSSSVEIPEQKKEGYTIFAAERVCNITDEESLLNFLVDNMPNFYTYSETAYKEFISLYKKAGDMQPDRKTAPLPSLSDEELQSWINNRLNNIADDRLINPEKLARNMLMCIPIASKESTIKGKKVITKDFIHIYNGENGQNSKKVKTTELPKQITMNLPVSDRLWDLIRRIKPVTRKDLVFMKFYCLSLEIEQKPQYSANDYYIFTSECNNMLVKCGMSRLYPGNRFENLILLSLLSNNPFEMFENIIEYSFMNEPSSEQEA